MRIYLVSVFGKSRALALRKRLFFTVKFVYSRIDSLYYMLNGSVEDIIKHIKE